jgi:predicted MFS family arabinose efflux permease
VSTELADRGVPHGRALAPALTFIALVVAVIGSLGAPLITAVAGQFRVSLASAQWTLTATLLAGAVATPVLGRLGSGSRRRPAILATLGLVLAGGVLTVLPPSFGWLLVGRTAQGVGLGLTPLTMGVARDHVNRSAATIGTLSVVSTVGVGVGYPLAGLLTEVGGLRLAYGMGLVVTAMAAAVAWRVIPDPPRDRKSHVDVPGALLLGAALLALMLILSESSLWSAHLVTAAGLLTLGVILLAAWALVERHSAAPLVDLTLLRHPAVAAANVTMLVGGASMYLLLTLVTRYMQTPHAAGYGFGASVLSASLVLIPFSALGFVGGRVTQVVRNRHGARAALVLGAASVVAASVFFAMFRSQVWQPYAVMALLGFGVGAFSAAMPGVILAFTPAGETSSAMGVNQVVRSAGFSAGSALGGLILAAYTQAGHAFPARHGYSTAALIGGAAMAATIGLTAAAQRAPGERGGEPVSGVVSSYRTS